MSVNGARNSERGGRVERRVTVTPYSSIPDSEREITDYDRRKSFETLQVAMQQAFRPLALIYRFRCNCIKAINSAQFPDYQDMNSLPPEMQKRLETQAGEGERLKRFDLIISRLEKYLRKAITEAIDRVNNSQDPTAPLLDSKKPESRDSTRVHKKRVVATFDTLLKDRDFINLDDDETQREKITAAAKDLKTKLISNYAEDIRNISENKVDIWCCFSWSRDQHSKTKLLEFMDSMIPFMEDVDNSNIVDRVYVVNDNFKVENLPRR